MTKKGREFNEIYDLTAMRVIVESVKDCYGAVGVIHSLWKPLPGRFKDMIAMPKFNMYQALHTTVIGPEGRPLEIQIRTGDMHERAEYGVAAHWTYKEDGGKGKVDPTDVKLKWLKSLLDEGEDDGRLGLRRHASRASCSTRRSTSSRPRARSSASPPARRRWTSPTRSTPTSATAASGAKVNGKIVPLHYTLQSGDIVEVLTSKRDRGPSRDWLAVVKTTRARNKIKHWFKQESRVDSEHTGRELLQEHLKKAGLPAQKITRLGAAGRRDPRDGLPQGRGLLHRARRREDLAQDRRHQGHVAAQAGRGRGRGADAPPTCCTRGASRRARRRSPRRSTGSWSRASTTSRCAWPSAAARCPGDPIVGYVSLGRGITIHRDDCPNAEALRKDPERFVEVAWEGENETSFKVELQVDGWDRHRLLEDLSRTFAEAGINIVEARCIVSHPMVKNRFVVEVPEAQTLKNVIARLRQIDAVFDAYRVTPSGG